MTVDKRNNAAQSDSLSRKINGSDSIQKGLSSSNLREALDAAAKQQKKPDDGSQGGSTSDKNK